MEGLLSFSFLKERAQLGRSISDGVSEVREAHEHRPGLLLPHSPMMQQDRDFATSTQPTVTLTSAIDDTTLLRPVLARGFAEEALMRARYHIFVSHAQKEASGDAATLFFLFEQMGIHGWRDMNQTDLTPEGMRHGVYDSDVFVVFLTNSYLSRPFCLAEVTYALEFGKPIIIITEEEERFWPFDLERWKRSECAKKGDEWVVDDDLQKTYETCPDHIRKLIEERAADGSMLTYRRRDFAADALIREIVCRASVHPGVSWGSQLPPAPARTDLDDNAQRRIYIFAKEADYTATVINECKASMKQCAPKTVWTDDIGSANHVLMILSKGCVDEGTASTALLLEAADARKTITFLYVTKESSEEEGWDFAPHADKSKSATKIFKNHEALKYRDATPVENRYEHDALMIELLKRMRVATDQTYCTSNWSTTG